MIKIISIGTDRKVFEKGSNVRSRLLKQREFFSELHVIVFTKASSSFLAEQIGNLWLYPTNSLTRWFYVKDAISLARGLAKQRDMESSDSIISVQDPFECGLVGLRTSRTTRLPLHVQVHTDFLNHHFRKLTFLNRVRVYIARRVLSHASGIRTVSKRISDSLRRYYPEIARKMIAVLPVFSSPRAIGNRRGNGGNLVLMVSRLAPEKDIPLALEVINQMRGSKHPIGLTIAGDGLERAKLERIVAESKLEDYVNFVSWQSDLSSVYNESDIALCTSKFEGFGLSMLEFAFAGIPLVTTDTGIASELVPSEYRRFVCPVGERVCIQARLQELQKNKKLREHYGEALRISAKKFIVPEKEYWQKYRKDIERCIQVK